MNKNIKPVFFYAIFIYEKGINVLTNSLLSGNTNIFNMTKKKKSNKELPKVHKDLKGFDVSVNSFGEIQMSYDIDKLNEFLNDNIEDKKLKHLREDEEEIEEE